MYLFSVKTVLWKMESVLTVPLDPTWIFTAKPKEHVRVSDLNLYCNDKRHL